MIFFFFYLPQHFPIILSASGAYKFPEFACSSRFQVTYFVQKIGLKLQPNIYINMYYGNTSVCVFRGERWASQY